jgi:hypothetical protein
VGIRACSVRTDPARAGGEHRLGGRGPDLLLAAGIRVEVVSKRLGHARISVTYDRYTHPDDEQQREAADASGRLLGRRWRNLMLAGCWRTARADLRTRTRP